MLFEDMSFHDPDKDGVYSHREIIFDNLKGVINSLFDGILRKLTVEVGEYDDGNRISHQRTQKKEVLVWEDIASAVESVIPKELATSIMSKSRGALFPFFESETDGDDIVSGSDEMLPRIDFVPGPVRKFGPMFFSGLHVGLIHRYLLRAKVASRVRYSASVYLAKTLECLVLQFLRPAETMVRESYGDYVHSAHMRAVIRENNILERIVRSVRADSKTGRMLPYDYLGSLISENPGTDEKKESSTGDWYYNRFEILENGQYFKGPIYRIMKIQHPFNLTIMPGALSEMGKFFYRILHKSVLAAVKEWTKQREEHGILTSEPMCSILRSDHILTAVNQFLVLHERLSDDILYPIARKNAEFQFPVNEMENYLEHFRVEPSTAGFYFVAVFEYLTRRMIQIVVRKNGNMPISPLHIEEAIEELFVSDPRP
jgi:hypothetical protein